MHTEQLVVFVKAPRPGTVKTRLATELGAQRAGEAYRTLVERLVQNLGSIRPVELRYTPDDASAEIKPWLRDGWTLAQQGEGDLGQRLCSAFEDHFAAGAKRVVVIGSDCPEIRAADIRTAWRELNACDVVVGPAVDGGYWLIALRQQQRELFRDIPWSSDQVLAQTLMRAREGTLRIQLLRILSDVDTPADWERFLEESSSQKPGRR